MNNIDMHKVLVVGLGYRTGLAVSNFLAARGTAVTVTDTKNADELRPVIEKLAPGIRVIAGHQGPGLLDDGYDAVILSPGVPKSIPLIREAFRKGLPVISEIELAYRYLKGRIIAITGTDGKSTTTALTGHVLKSLGLDTFVGGNIGIPLISFVEDTTEISVSVIELSSYQLETIVDFRPDVASVLNVTPDHQDRYNGMDDYVATKFRIAMNQTGDDCFVYNRDDELLRKSTGGVGSRILSFSLSDSTADIIYKNGKVFIAEGGKETEVLEPLNMRLMGLHNIQNAMASILMVRSLLEMLKMDIDYGAIAGAIYSFEGLEHRMERVGQYMGRHFINDSKATTVGAVEMAVKSVSGQSVLILGGRTKGDDYARLSRTMEGRVRAIVLIGESKDEFAGLYSGFRCIKAQTIDDAVAAAMRESVGGDHVLFSPACASFDMFKNFEERGEAFRTSFNRLTRGELTWT